MGSIEITTEPHELIINGTKILMQADPSASQAWMTLLDIEVSWKTPETQAESMTTLTAALSALTETPEDAETLQSLGVGLATLKKAAEGYVVAVTGFPTQPPASSRKR